jgi:deoxyribodipyrimidine photo-lyase
MLFPPTRVAALARLDEFLPNAAAYAARRNFDAGAGQAGGVSRLSPYIRTRLLTEEEITRAVLARHSARAAEKFLQEIAWRTYWKGWLEMRPEIWCRYRSALAALPKDQAYENAVAGRSGIDCFDHWAGELRETGYLHNHARMWFASIWIFTLRLPWQLGADFFLTHLLDADPAANTLSWRWVAGLHTPGKHYLARAENIARFTGQRFHPVGQLEESAPPLPIDALPEPQPLILPGDQAPQGRIGHLRLPDDLAPPPARLGRIAATAGWLPPVLETTPQVSSFLHSALRDALASCDGTQLSGSLTDALGGWIVRENLDAVLLSLPTVGPVRELLAGGLEHLPLRLFVRDWDRTLWPHACRGFFRFKAALPLLHSRLTPPETGAQARGRRLEVP